ncbi:MAG TPA: hypothetical protein VKD69_08325 [Vicinamibacterales bacterium]|nr:hypothetical protein [Vicinamibacterales bacterium]
MKLVAWMAAASIGSWLAIAALVDARARTATFAGMAGPLAVAAVSWLLSERAWRRNPAALTSLMTAAFAGKMVFFGLYVAVALKVLAVAPAPFVASFAAYFIALHLTEALALKGMFAGTARKGTGD